MKNIIIRAIFLIVSLHLHGQIQYPSKSNYFVQNNTAIGSTGYFKIKNYVDSLVFDSLSKGIDHYSYYSSDSSKKYHVKSDNQRTWIKFNDTGYTKIFDFTLNSSDSFRFYYTPNSNHIISWTWVKIDSTSSIKINGINHKCIYTSPLGFLKFQFVQGVGTLQRGINYWQFGGTGRREFLLGICSDTGYLWEHDWDYKTLYTKQININNCQAVRTLLKVNNFEPIDLDIYPNPCNETVKIKNAMPNKNLELIDIYGRVLISSKTNLYGDCEIDLRRVPQGVHYLIIKDCNHTAVKRLLIQRN